jgi:hypothetical protein
MAFPLQHWQTSPFEPTKTSWVLCPFGLFAEPLQD